MTHPAAPPNALAALQSELARQRRDAGLPTVAQGGQSLSAPQVAYHDNAYHITPQPNAAALPPMSLAEASQWLLAHPGRAPRSSSPFRGAHLITARHRTASADRTLALVLACIAGCANAGGFIALGSYTSHMTGYLSQIADNLVLGNLALVARSLAAIASFVTGAAASAYLINWARQTRPDRQYALPIAVQGGLFLALSALGALPLGAAARGPELILLCAIMGFQNATITKISGARIRTSHATGMITDVGIELGRAAFGATLAQTPLGANKRKLTILLQLLAVFLLGGIVGAIGYSWFGFLFSLPLAAVLLVLSHLQRPPKA